MRIRTLLYTIAAVLVAGLAYQNWAEITRPSTLTLGVFTTNAPLGLILLGLFVLACLLFAASSAKHLSESRQHARALQAQRDLADKAEQSRFTELRQRLDDHLRESRQRESASASDIEQTVSRVQRELRQQVEQLHRALSTRMGEMEARLGHRGDDRQTVHSSPMASTTPSAHRSSEPLETVVPRHEGSSTHVTDVNASHRIG